MENHCVLCSIKQKGLLEFMTELDIQCYLALKNMFWFTAGLEMLQEKKRGITYVFSDYYARIKVDSYDSLPLEKTLTLHKFIILIKSVFNKDKNNYYYNLFLEKDSYELPKNNDNK